MKNINLNSNVFALQYINILRFATMFVIGIFFSRTFSKVEIGYYEILLFLTSAVSYFWLRGFIKSFLSVINDKQNKTIKKEIYFNTFLLIFLFSLLAAFVLLLFKNHLSLLSGSNETVFFFKPLLLYIILSIPSFFIEYIFIGENKAKNVIYYGTTIYTLQLLFVIVPALFTSNITYSVYGLITVVALRFIYLLFLLFRYSSIKIIPSFLKSHIKLSFPLIFSALIAGSGQYIDGFLVTHFYSAGMFAIFRYGARELPIVSILANSMSNAFLPEFSKNGLLHTVQKLKKSSTRLIHMLFPITIVLLIISNILFPLFFTKNFTFSAKIFNIYLLMIIPRLLFPQTILTGMKKNNVFMWVSPIEIIINVVLSIAGIYWFGILGIAFATIISATIEKAILIFIVKKHFNIKAKEYLPVKWYLLYSVILIPVYVFIDYYWFV